MNETRGTVLVADVTVATTWWMRAKGLLGRRSLEPGAAMVFPRCRSIHTVGMQFPIDVLFVDKTWRVVAIQPNLGPWRIVGPFWKAWAAIELAAGSIARADPHMGDQLRLTPTATPRVL